MKLTRNKIELSLLAIGFFGMLVAIAPQFEGDELPVWRENLGFALGCLTAIMIPVRKQFRDPISYILAWVVAVIGICLLVGPAIADERDFGPWLAASVVCVPLFVGLTIAGVWGRASARGVNTVPPFIGAPPHQPGKHPSHRRSKRRGLA